MTTSELADLPQNAIGDRIRSKQPNVSASQGADQVALLSVALPSFAVAVHRAAPDTSEAFSSTQGPHLVPKTDGNAWVVTKIAGPLAAARLWEMLRDPHTFGL